MLTTSDTSEHLITPLFVSNMSEVLMFNDYRVRTYDMYFKSEILFQDARILDPSYWDCFESKKKTKTQRLISNKIRYS